VPVIGPDAAEVDLQPAVRRAELREILVELRHPTPQRRIGLHEVDVAARLGRLDGRADPGHPAADHEDSSLPADGGGPVPVGTDH